MSIQDFFNKWNGQGCDFDGEFGHQCMDIAEQYNQDVIGAPRLGGNAVDVWMGYPKGSYDQIPNAPDNYPQLGDLIVWGSEIGEFGHIAIATDDGDTSRFKSFDQNFPINSACHFQEHNYNGVLGFLRPHTTQDLQKAIDDLRTARDTNWNLYQGEVTKNADLSIKIKVLQDSTTNLEGQVSALTDENAGLKKNVSDVQKQNADLADTLKAHNESDSTAIDTGIQAQGDYKKLLLEKEAIATELNCDDDQQSIIKAIESLNNQLALAQKTHEDQARLFNRFIQFFIKTFIRGGR